MSTWVLFSHVLTSPYHYWAETSPRVTCLRLRSPQGHCPRADRDLRPGRLERRMSAREYVRSFDINSGGRSGGCCLRRDQNCEQSGLSISPPRKKKGIRTGLQLQVSWNVDFQGSNQLPPGPTEGRARGNARLPPEVRAWSAVLKGGEGVDEGWSQPCRHSRT